MTNFEKVGLFMKTFGQEVKNKPSLSTDKINKSWIANKLSITIKRINKIIFANNK